ncbi:4-oxalomesaconate tautomerase [Gynuella sp.]|uniref:4-oxalomesaconate tautomerase n=1 Tax=Gynuella sp. TaxID=2969146 RepID=UPI003D0B70C1
MQTAIPCTMMRGGTSRGPYFLATDLPDDWATQEQVLLAAMGSPNRQQIDGIGGGTSLTSKAAILSRSSHPQADVDYLFAQVGIDRLYVDIAPSCGNILAGVGPFAIDAGLVEATEDETIVRVRNVNTDKLIEVRVKTPNGQVEYEGDTRIDGVEGTAAPVLLNFLDVAGSKTGSLLPTGNVVDIIEGVPVSCIDAAVPMVLIAAHSLGKTGAESKTELDSDTDLLARIEKIRVAASWKMGLGDAKGKVVPKVALVSAPRHGGTLTSRYFVPDNCHASHAVTGAICVSSSILLPGSVSASLAGQVETNDLIRLEHPSGQIDIMLDAVSTAEGVEIRRAGVVRTARMLFRGELYVPSSIWTGNHSKAS